jgi:homoserine acetyltransferase
MLTLERDEEASSQPARILPSTDATDPADLPGVDLQVIRSQRGHDGFLVEIDKINAVLVDALT